MERMTAAEYRELTAKKPSKMRNEITKVDGIKFRSRLEANYYSELKLLQRAGEVTEIKLQPRYPLLEPTKDKDGKRVPGIEYVADFLVTYADGHQEIVDTKGAITYTYRMKKRMFVERYPTLTIKEVTR